MRQVCVRLTILSLVIAATVVLALWRAPASRTVSPRAARPIAAVTPAPKPIVAPKPSPKPALRMLVFTATWCGYCQQQKPLVAQIEATGVQVQRIDIDEQPEMARQFKVTAVPTYVFYDGNGEPYQTHDANEIVERLGPK